MVVANPSLDLSDCDQKYPSWTNWKVICLDGAIGWVVTRVIWP